MKYLVTTVLFVCCALSALFADTASDNSVLATWQGGQFTKGDLDARISKIPPASQAQYKTQDGQTKILDWMCLEQVFYLEGLKMHMDTDSNTVANINANYRPILAQNYREHEFKKNVVITPEDEQQFFQANIKRYYTERPMTTIMYIQVANDSCAQAANDMFARNVEFTDVMNSFSINKISRQNAGKISNIRGNGYIPGIGRDNVLDSLITVADMNKLYGPVKTDTGISFFKVIDRVPERVKTFAECEQDVRTKLEPLKESENYTKAVQALTEQHHVQYNDGLIARVDFTRNSANKLDSLMITGDLPELNIRVSDFFNHVRSQPPQEQGALQDQKGRKRVLQGMIEDILFSTDAIAKGYADSASVKETLDQVRRSTIVRAVYSKLVTEQVQIPEEQKQAYYQAHPERYTVGPYRKIQSFVFSDRKVAEKTLKQARKALKKSDDNQLSALVQQYSELKTKDGTLDNIAKNGSIPGIGPDSLYSSLVWHSEVGKFSDVFPNAQGKFVFFRLLEERPASLKPFEEVRYDIERKVIQDSSRVLTDKVCNQLKQAYQLQEFPERLQVKLSAEELFDMANEAQTKKQYRQAIQYYEQIIKIYKDGTNDYKALFMEGFLYAEDMNDTTMAKTIFNKVINDYPQGELRESAEYMLKNLNGDADVLKEINNENQSQPNKE